MTRPFDHATDTDLNEPREFFGVHVPELQLSNQDLEDAMNAADLTTGERYLELGCGHGRGLVAAAQRDAIAIGVDYLEDALEQCRVRAAAAKVEVTLIHDDLQRVDPTNSDVVLMHLGPAFHDRLAPRLEHLLAPTTRLVAAGWRVPGWLPVAGSANNWDGGWVYQPGNPRLHGLWIPATDIGPDPGPEHVYDTPLTRVQRDQPLLVGFRIGADLDKIEVRVTGDAAANVTTVCSATSARRGQALLLRIDASPSNDTAALEVWARSRSGRITRRGESLPLLLPPA